MSVPDKILELVERYGKNQQDYRKTLNEEDTRVQLINPMWECLGWDMDNSLSYAKDYTDVRNEAALKMGHSSKAPDYSFGIGPTRKFFLEAKKPGVNIDAENDPAYQLRRYAYTAKFSLSVLSNFWQLAIYDGKVAPARSDQAKVARLKLWTFNDYADPKKWEEISGLLSRKAILQGEFDLFAASKTKKGTASFDEAFLREIEGWRELLARDIASKNTLSDGELNLAVGKIIDRIIFLRICEENGIEPGLPLHALRNGVNLYPRMVELFRKSDDRYNSGLFHFDIANKRREAPDETTTHLTISNTTIKSILSRLYYPDTPYAFDFLPLDILGQIYERFLGKVIIQDGKKTTVEPKPEVRKAGGVYYTPSYIVKYIVQNTVAPLMEGRIPAGKNPIKILDPACGSGSFLLGAYAYLLDWYLDWYRENDPHAHAKKNDPPIFEAPSPGKTSDEPNWRLTSRERKRIVREHIFGVDLDPQAVEVTKLSLLLKVMEGETAQSVDLALKSYKERALPDLGDNVKCGNSLIGPDFYSPKDPEEWERRNALSEEERDRINDFNWPKEFAPIMSKGGFDAVIGNPPYVQSRSGRLVEMDKAYFEQEFVTAEYQLNLYSLFMEKGMALLHRGGLLSYIIPNYWLSTDYDARLRSFLFRQNQVRELLNVYRVFEAATVDTLVVIAERGQAQSFPQKVRVRSVDRKLKTISSRLEAVRKRDFTFEQTIELTDAADDVRLSFARSLQLKGERTLGEFCVAKFGMKPYQVNKGVPKQTRAIVDEKRFNSKIKIDDKYMPLLRAGGVQRYGLLWEGDWIRYGSHLAEPRTSELFKGSRILVQRIVSRPRLDGTWTDEEFICNTDVITLKLRPEVKNFSLKFITGVLLSRLCGFVVKAENVNLDRAAFPKINTNTLSQLPLPQLDFSNKADKVKHDRMVKLVDTRLNLHSDLQKADSANEREKIGKRIETTDAQIDSLVYELYGLTDDEIALVEGG